MLQKSVFGNKFEIVVNFFDSERVYKNKTLKPNGLITEEL